MKPKALTTHDLKERSWTPAMIRDLLGQPDATRPSEMRVGRRGRQVDAQVKLYLEERVQAAETTAQFARHQEAARARQDSAEKAQATKRERIEAQLTAFVDAYTPTIIPPAEGVEPGSKPHWKANLRGLDSFEFSEPADELLRGLKGRSWSEAKRRVYEKHRAAFHASLGQVES